MGAARADFEKLKGFVVGTLERVGVTSEAAQIVAEVLVTTDMRGVRTHGTRQLRGYVRQILAGGMIPNAAIEILNEGPTWAIVDAHAGLGVVAAYKSMQMAICKARGSVVGMVGVRNSNHFGATGYYAMLCAKENMIGLAMTNGDPTMSAPGSAGRVLANNPLAYAVPASGEVPVALDIALSVVAGVKVHQAAREGRLVPKGWIIDKKGAPTTNPADFEEGGAHVPIGGYKGFGLALMVEILAGVMTGAGITNEVTSFVQQPARPSNVGHFFMAIDVGRLIPMDVFRARVGKLVDEIKSSPKAKGIERIYLPGEMEHEEEEQARIDGIVLDETTMSNLRALAEDLGIEKEDFENIFLA
jgi:ureidoglycolate dehydrogenase (NAD+)